MRAGTCTTSRCASHARRSSSSPQSCRPRRPRTTRRSARPCAMRLRTVDPPLEPHGGAAATA
eukprot:7039501-Prymnesium_polylepis.1